MKLQLQQALATVLNIQIQSLPDLGSEDGGITTPKYADHFICLDHPLVSLGKVANTHLGDAVLRAIALCKMEDDSNFAVFPISSNREDYYMAIEREMLRQEQSLEFDGKKMWELMGNDPRELITAIMAQMRECATTLTHPVIFQTALLRAGCLVVASLQWTSDWITRCKVRNAALQIKVPPKPEVLSEIDKVSEGLIPSFPSEFPSILPASFGIEGTGLRVLDSTDKIMEANDICSLHDEHRPCKECAQDLAVVIQRQHNENL